MKKVADPAVMAIFELLVETFPKCFSIFEGRRRPLKVGIHLDILAVLDGAVTPVELRKALRAYVSNKVYQSRLVVGAVRIALDGAPAGVVTAEEAPPPPNHKVAAPPRPLPPVKTQPQTPKRHSLGDLREAARRRQSLADA